MKKYFKVLYLLTTFVISIALLLACNSSEEPNNEVLNNEIHSDGNTKKDEVDNKNVKEDTTNKDPVGIESEGDNENLKSDEFSKDEENTSSEIEDIPSIELIKEIKIGWNLGNTLDATGGGRTLMAETSWGNPKTTDKIFDMVKEAGFNTVRIPISWGNHIGEQPDYKIDDIWIDRVQVIVDYAIERNLYVILNMHHEDWHFPSYENYEEAKDILTMVWAQIADRFAEYNEHLIFEGMNEPRMTGTGFEWNGGNKEGRDVVNQLNNAFVETIRSGEGNNPLRHLMIPTYAASSDTKTWKDFTIPKDDKVIISIHAYTPYNFALNESGTSVWELDNHKDTSDIESLMNNLYNNFVSKGYPVIIGEFGSRDKNNLEARASWAKYYIEAATEKGIPCIWWDNGALTGSGELFGLLDRRTLTWKYPDIVDALMQGLE